jgi:hypothetical protein
MTGRQKAILAAAIFVANLTILAVTGLPAVAIVSTAGVQLVILSVLTGRPRGMRKR